jgi:aryl-alcohol dehydrogenase (NADP+)
MSIGAEWGLNESDARAQIAAAFAAGVNFFDTADVYGRGNAERILGETLKEIGGRDAVVIASKVYMPMGPGPNLSGLGRKHILSSIDGTLRRLGTDHIDLYQIHRFDAATPIEETLEALDAIVKAGKVRYIGACSMFAWQLMKMLGLSERRGLSHFVSMQNHYNLLYREEEREMIPLCLEEGVGVLPWSPLARGQLARSGRTARGDADRLADSWYPPTEARAAILAAVRAIADERGVSPAQIALAWLLSRDGVVAPIIGVSKPHHLADAVAAVDLGLSQADIQRLETGYAPVAVAGIHPPWR